MTGKNQSDVNPFSTLHFRPGWQSDVEEENSLRGLIRVQVGKICVETRAWWHMLWKWFVLYTDKVGEHARAVYRDWSDDSAGGSLSKYNNPTITKETYRILPTWLIDWILT